MERSLTELDDGRSRAIFRNQRGPVPKSSVVTLVRALVDRLLENEHGLLKAVAVAKIGNDEDAVRAATQTAAPGVLQSVIARGFLSTREDGSVRISQVLAHVLALNVTA